MELTKEEIEDFRAAFNKVDLDKNGVIDRQELATMLRECKKRMPTERQINQVFDAADINKNGVIEFNEFIAVVTDIRSEKEKVITECFKQFDIDGNGKIDRHELTQIIKKTEDDILPTEIDTLLESYDVNLNGVIDFDEFIKIYHELVI